MATGYYGRGGAHRRCDFGAQLPPHCLLPAQICREGHINLHIKHTQIDTHAHVLISARENVRIGLKMQK